MNFGDLISRADDETLQILLGSAAIRLLKLLDPGLATPTRLREILLELRSPKSLLLSKEYRNLLIELLRPEQAKILAVILNQPNHSDTFEQLKKLRIRHGSEQERTLLEFFEVSFIEPELTNKTSPTEPITPAYSLFSHQRKAVRKVKHYLNLEPKRVLLHMPTGSGKTRTAMNIVTDYLRSQEPALVVWLAYSEELCEQAATEFQRAWQYLGDRDVSLHRFWGNHDLELDQVRDGIVVAGLSKIYSRAKTSIQFINRLGSRSSLVVIDEAHQAIAETYRLVLDALVVPYDKIGLLGLTATPGRTWADVSADAELADFFARRKVTLEIPGYDSPVDYLVAEGYLAKANYRPLFYESGLSLTERDLNRIKDELELPQHLLDRLAEDEQRNLRILLEIEDLALRHQRIIVFGISVQHSKLLAAVLRARGFVADAVTGDTPPQERERLISSFKDSSPETKILCNYGVLTTGFDAPRTSAAVIARPTKSLVLYSQMVGRAIRGVRAGGNETAEIVTVIDSDLPGFGSVAEAFSNWEDVWRQN
ncbi:DEAD/DEAH box helicase [Leptolyngbya sp. FACHB-671]|uniref:DEAD/DEAH box helicase n=1 Tax=Leptolyngbya sp. FACHB-671 TaxID=2692812 RepID=UPI001688C255|nr:DEAD/DEAH box helicase [Leptolyngbya sp. FACHB-671]MBD2069791.1 DEAD/DEAH box helicase [Leptolyngbya sp. FACHB-671]